MKNHTTKTLEPPGGILIWIVIFIELITFGIALLFFILNGKENQMIFHDSALQLNKNLAFFNTVVLITSGYTMAEAVRQFKISAQIKFKTYTLITIFLGCIFILLKFVEYNSKFHQNINFNSNTFYTFYFMLTGFHVIHVLFGLVLLGYSYFSIKNIHSNHKLEDIEAITAFWHMCDLIWLLLFPVIYLLY